MRGKGVTPLSDTSKTDDAVKKSLDYAVRDGAGYSAMVGFGESYVNPAALFLGARDLHIGLLTSIPFLAGAWFQMVSAECADRWWRRRTVYLSGAVIQALTWILMAAALFLNYPANIILLIASFSLYIMAFNFSAAAWTSTIGDLVPEDHRGRYFGRRSMICEIVQVLTLVAAGIFLHAMKVVHWERYGFLGLFILALLSRLASSYFLARMTDPPYRVRAEDRFTLMDFLRRAPGSNFGRFVFFTTAMFFGVGLIGPFIVPYQLRVLRFSYFEYTAALVVHFAVMYVSMVYWGKWGDRIGNWRILQITAFGLSAVPFMWMGVTTVPAALIVQVFAGFTWGGFALSTNNFIYDSVTPPKRARCFAYYTLFTSLAIFAGATLGGLFAERLGPVLKIGPIRIHLLSGLQWLMALAGFWRLLTTVAFLRSVREVRIV